MAMAFLKVGVLCVFVICGQDWFRMADYALYKIYYTFNENKRQLYLCFNLVCFEMLYKSLTQKPLGEASNRCWPTVNR